MKANEISKILETNFLKELEKSGDRGLRLSQDYKKQSEDYIVLSAIFKAFGETMKQWYDDI